VRRYNRFPLNLSSRFADIFGRDLIARNSMGRRRDKRVPINLMVRVFGTDVDGRAFTRLAQTMDVSFSGVRIAGIYVRLNVGDVLGLQHGGEKGRFRVVWAGERGSNRAGELGLRMIDPIPGFWGIELKAGEIDDYEFHGTAAERRKHERYQCDIGVKVKTGVDAHDGYARCTDISLGGCYLETWSPATVGSMLNLDIRLPSGDVTASAIVRTAHPAFGMGVQFANLSAPGVLREFIDGLRHSSCNRDVADLQIAGVVKPVTDKRGGSEKGTLRVLVAEDSRFLQNAYAYCLRREGFEAIIAHDGEEAVALAASERPDIIVLDLLMPRMGGMDALKLLKCDPATSGIPVIVLSGLSQGNEPRLISEGAVIYLEKSSVGPERLADSVRSVLAKQNHSTERRRWLPSRDNENSRAEANRH
jgi:CheY-like chemotaxis protein